MAEKVTLMKLKVDLHCSKCYKKVKKVLSKFPEIRGQVFDDKQNIVSITVVCFDPEEIRDKLCCKGDGAIKSIEIVEPPKRDVEKRKGETEKNQNPGKPDKTKDPVPVPVQPQPPPPVAVPAGIWVVPCCEGRPCGPCFHGYGPPIIVYDGYYGWPVYNSYGGGRRYYVSCCDRYLNEENPWACSIM